MDEHQDLQDAAIQIGKDIVAKNNQSTLLLNRIFKDVIQEQSHSKLAKMVAFQGDTRIFFFDGGNDGDMTDEEEKQRKEQFQDLLLKLYVAPVIRLMQLGVTFFGLLDNASYACILLLFFGSSILETEDESHIDNIFDGKDASNIASAVTLASDLLHNVMHSSTRLWNLGRVDLQLVLVLYVAYITILWSGGASWVYWYVLGFRFGVFYLSTCCDYWLERIVLTMVRKLKAGEDFVLSDFPLSTCCTLSMANLGYPYSRLNQGEKDALEAFKGSFCCWDWRQSSVRFLREYHASGHFQESTSKWSPFVGILAFPGGIVALILSALLLLLLVILALIPVVISTGFVYLFQCCCQCCNWGIHEEIWLF